MGTAKIVNFGAPQQLYSNYNVAGVSESNIAKGIVSLKNQPVKCSVKVADCSSLQNRIYKNNNPRPIVEEKPQTMDEWKTLVNNIAKHYRNIAVNSGDYNTAAKIPPCNVSGDTALEMISYLDRFIESEKKAKVSEQGMYVKDHSNTAGKIKAIQAKVSAIDKIVTDHVRLDKGVYKSYSRNYLDILDRFFSVKYKESIKKIQIDHDTSRKDKILSNLNKQITDFSIESDNVRHNLGRVNKDIRSYNQDLKILNDARVFFSTPPK